MSFYFHEYLIILYMLNTCITREATTVSGYPQSSIFKIVSKDII